MVDLTPFTRDGEGSKIKSLMGRTPGILKSKFLSVLGNSNELLNGISNKLDITLSLSTSTDSDEECEDDEEECNIPRDESIDLASIDFESRRVKERRAHEEILSGRFRHPNFTPKIHPQEDLVLDLQKPISSSSDSSKSSTYSNSIDSKSPNPADSDLEEEMRQLNGLLTATPAIDIIPPAAVENGDLIDTRQLAHRMQKTSNSSTLTSLNDAGLPSGSLESSDLRVWIRSESENSVPSWASSISLDSQTEQTAKEFMKHFVEVLFTNSSSIGLELKSEFGQRARTEAGRLWFSRFVNSQRTKAKRVDETTFYSLVQYFAIILFECAESEDFSPAKNLMNMCFTFYHEIEVPGCEPYREYLFTYLRMQPIWHTLRFWNAAFFDALQCERAHHPVPKTKKSKTKKADGIIAANGDAKQHCLTENDASNSTGSSAPEEVASLCELKEDQKFQQNITFGQLGTFTCNMHAFGLSKDLCLEFLKKQSTIANLPKEQEKLLRDNINRMYLETDKWGA